MTTTGTPAETMDFSFDEQRAYCIRLGLLPPAADPRSFYDDRQASEVMILLEGMRRARSWMLSAARWIRDGLDRADQRFTGREIHAAAADGIARHALDYDTALAAYTALQDHLTALVNQIRRDQGYEPGSFSLLEDHPALPPEQDKAARALQAAERHLAEYAALGPAAQRRHLRGDHGGTLAVTGEDLAGLHEQQHAEEITALRARAVVPA